jgi:hypothetical protein
MRLYAINFKQKIYSVSQITKVHLIPELLNS